MALKDWINLTLNIGFVDDCSLFAQTTGGMQVLMNTVQEFEEWSGLKVNLKKTCMLRRVQKTEENLGKSNLSR